MSADFFSKLAFSGLLSECPEQDGHPVGADLGPNGLQRLLVDDKSFRGESRIS